MRIEVREKYPIDGLDPEYLETLANLKLAPPQREWGYRRTLILIDQIERPIEIPGNTKECLVRMWSGDDLVILANYDDFCVKLNDVEEEMLVERELLIHEIDQAANQQGD